MLALGDTNEPAFWALAVAGSTAAAWVAVIGGATLTVPVVGLMLLFTGLTILVVAKAVWCWRHGYWACVVLLAGLWVYLVPISVELLFKVAYSGSAGAANWPRTFATDSVLSAAAASWLALASTNVGMALVVRRHHAAVNWRPDIAERRALRTGALLAGCLLAGSLPIIVGGDILSRSARLNDDLAGLGRLLSVSLAVPLVSTLACRYALKRTNRMRVSVLAGGGLAAFGHIAQGDRRYAVYIVLAALLGYVMAAKVRPSFSRLATVLVGLLLIYALLIPVGRVRIFLPDVRSGELRAGELLQWIEENRELAWYAPSATDFKGPYLSLLTAVDDPSFALVTTGYLRNLTGLLPSGLRRDFNLQPLSLTFADEMVREYPSRFVEGHGFGYSPVTEALVIGGWGWVVLSFAGFGLLLVAANRRLVIRHYPVTSVVLALQAWNFARVGTNSIRESVLMIAVAALWDRYLFFRQPAYEDLRPGLRPSTASALQMPV